MTRRRRGRGRAWPTLREGCELPRTGGWVDRGRLGGDRRDRRASPQQVIDATADGTLADDETYQDWTDEVGDAGVMSMYAAPDAGKFLAEMMEPSPAAACARMAMTCRWRTGARAPAVPEELTETLEDFQGMAATLRFDDGALEFEVAGAAGDEARWRFWPPTGATTWSPRCPRTPPPPSASASPRAGSDRRSSRSPTMSGGEMTVEDMEAELEAPPASRVADIETLAGESAALVAGQRRRRGDLLQLLRRQRRAGRRQGRRVTPPASRTC